MENKPCPYCGSKVVLADSAVIYGKSFGNVWMCSDYPQCDAYSGVHKSDGVTPLGTLANSELREIRKRCHNDYFDPIWKSGKMTRSEAYIWMQDIMGLPAEEAHIGMFTVEQCKTLIAEIQSMEPKNEIVKISTSLFSKSKVEEVRNDIVERTLNGELDPLQVQMAINYYEKVFNGDDKKDNGLKHQIKAAVLKAFEPYGKETELHGFKLEAAEAGVKYDYSADAIWDHLNQELESEKEKLKIRETQLKALKIPDRDKGESNNSVVDPSTSELYEEMPPVKTSTSIVKFTLKK